MMCHPELYPKIHAVAQVLDYRYRRNRIRLLRTANAYREFAHTCDIACFYAYLHFGGDVARPHHFDFAGNGITLDGATAIIADDSPFMSQARHYLLRELEGRNTSYGDERSRLLAAPTRTVPSHLAWDIWNFVPGRGEHVAGIEPSLDHLDQDNLLEDLQAVLSDFEAWVLYQHYWAGRTLRAIAHDVVAGEYPRGTRQELDYSDAKGHARAEKWVQKTHSRALERAEARLNPKWRAVHADLQPAN